MAIRQYWVIGGEYRDTSFRELTKPPAEAVGPFTDYDRALTVWRERSLATLPQAHVRYTITVTTAA
jgi:hypothetical protein